MDLSNRKTIVSVADGGDRLETLQALRHKLALTIHKSTSGRDIAALSKQLREVMDEIESMRASQEAEDPEKVTVLDLVRKKHEAS